LSDTKLSPELRADIQKLTGQAYDADAVSELTRGIQIELPEYVAAVTTQPGSQADRVHVVLVAAKISESEALKNNINSRYIVDAVELGGSFKATISDALNTDLQGMVGKNLDNARAEELRERIVKEISSSSVSVTRKLRRGGTPQHVRILYDINRSTDNLGFNFSGIGMYHSRQGFSIPPQRFHYHHLGTGTLSFRMANDPHELIERYAGASLSYGVERGPVRFDVTYSSYRAQWKENTLQADAQSASSPGLYRMRDTIDAAFGASFSESLPLKLNVQAGAEFAGLQMQSPVKSFEMSNTLKARLSGQKTFKVGATQWNYGIRSGTGLLDSDFIYTQHQWDINYSFNKGFNTVSVKFLGGRITGNAPMFERFSIGNATTLRGWNKYEINPLGGDRLAYGSVEYTYRVLTGFYDLGSVWSAGHPATTRSSAGLIFRYPGPCKGKRLLNPLCWAGIGVGFPINGNGARPSLILGI
jgi:hypothetical protein